jgi:predicted PurR-regulated permease PerM
VKASVFSGRAKTAFLFGLAAIAVAVLFWIQKVVLLAFLGLLIAIVLDAIAKPGIRFLKMPRGAAVIVAALIFLSALAGTLSLLLIPILREGTGFMESIPQRAAILNKKIEQYRNDFPWLKQVLPNPKDTESKTPPAQMAKNAFGTASAILEGAFEALATFFLAIYLAWNPERWLRGVAELWPRGSPEQRIALYRKIGDALRSYLFTIGVYVLAMGTMWTLGLWLIGIEYPLLFGAIGGLVEIVPYIGPTLGLIPPLLVAMTMGKVKMLYVVLLYIILHVIEGYILVPYLLHRKEHLPPPIVILSILAFGTLFGILGVLLAIPLGTVAYVLADELIYKKREAQSLEQ